MKIVILGAGVIGVSTAYYLNKLGHEVMVIERNQAPAEECSFANGGQISFSHSEPWATPDVLLKIPQWLLDKDSPLVFRPSLDINMWKWALSFLKHCNTKDKLQTTKNTLRLALHGKPLFEQLIAETGIEFSYSKSGTLHVFRNHRALNANINQAKFQKEFGCDYEILTSRAECEAKEPSLKYSPSTITSGLFFPIDEIGDVNKFTVNLAKHLEKKGVIFHYNQEVTEILTKGEKIEGLMTHNAKYDADIFVITAGANSPVLTKQIGINLPIYPMKGYSISIPIQNPEKAPKIGITDQYNKIVYSKLGNILRVAGTAEFAGYNDTIRRDRIRSLKKMVLQLFPGVGNLDEATEWACLRPSTPEGSPIIGRTLYENLFLNTGHGTLGWTLSLSSAQILSEIVHYGHTDFDLTGLTLAKY